MKISWNNTLNDLCKDYLDSLEHNLDKPRSIFKRTPKLTDEIKNLIKKFFCYVDPDSREKDNFETQLIAYALRHNIEDVVKLFEGELEALPLFLLGEQWSKLWSIFMNLEV